MGDYNKTVDDYLKPIVHYNLVFHDNNIDCPTRYWHDKICYIIWV